MRAMPVRESLLKALFFSAAFLPATYLITGCNSYSLGNLSTAATISASSSDVRVNQTLQLTSQSLSSGMALTFYVNGVQGGNSEFGTISNAGLYTAPAVIPTPDSVTITSSSVQYPTAPQGSVSLQIWNPIPVLGSVTPSGFSEGSTTVTVDGSQFIYGAQISWNGALVPTTYVSSTELVAMIAAPNPGTYPLTVTNPNPGSASAPPISLKVGPGQVVLQLQTNGSTDVRVSNSLNFGLTVNGTDNPAVTLQVNGVAGGNAQVGTAVSNKDGSITYHGAGSGPHSQQYRAAHDHQRRQSGGLDCAEHLGDESDSDSQFRLADVVQSRVGHHRAHRPEVHHRRAGAGERNGGGYDLQQRHAIDGDGGFDRAGQSRPAGVESRTRPGDFGRSDRAGELARHRYRWSRLRMRRVSWSRRHSARPTPTSTTSP